jgi:preprotein translocase subunit SecB
MVQTFPPLNCSGYFVTSMVVAANPDHKPQEKIELSSDDLSVSTTCACVEKSARRWQVQLSIRQAVGPAKNAPYNFRLVMIGAFEVVAGFPAEHERRLVEVTAASLLMGAAREVLRAAMSSGPYAPMLLPTWSFFHPDKAMDGTKTKNSAAK